jgi:hypothetical protein
MKKKQKVSDLQNQLHTIKKELDVIQEKCTHPSTTTKFDKKNSIRLFCVECDKKVGMPSQHQIEEFLKGTKDKK